MNLHVNVDHVATVRQARRGREPDPVAAALECELGGADGITCHLREDRRHVQERDVRLLRELVQGVFNLELAFAPEVVALALEVRPEEVCVVPERREEVTTEGGLDVLAGKARLLEGIPRFKEKGILVSLFVEPDARQIEAAAAVRADFVELHTGAYANAARKEGGRELKRLREAARHAHGLGLRVNAGHGLDYRNVSAVADLPHVEELNIGHAIVSRAVFVGLREAVRQMKALLAPTPEAP
ncbi:MAG TPA: pyridoxine 5'-phosphate synthase [Planctomycetota bacterium]|jgi:pyridoxine 5-phosphate synthase|nr:pyridoxine 5'-phosphate synthase [Planctomycetota bacterium]